MTDIQELTAQEELAILQDEMKRWLVDRYRLETRHRINSRIGSPPNVMDALVKDLESIQKYINELANLINDLQKTIVE